MVIASSDQATAEAEADVMDDPAIVANIRSFLQQIDLGTGYIAD
jgi:hypothetical protein